ncbi:MAG TPA: ATP-binding protein [Solirubrobacteraceae bacterium]|nr:ATP-binding protein [Solirubrobacteraceae bacterium]
MVTAKGQLAVVYPAIAEAVPRARAAVADFARQAGMKRDRIEGLRLAVSEAVTNVVRHAYPSGSGMVGVTAGRAGDELWVLITDEGSGHQSPSKNPGLGFGLGIIAHECDEVVVTERSHGGTEVRMRFMLRRSPTKERSPIAKRRRPGKHD